MARMWPGSGAFSLSAALSPDLPPLHERYGLPPLTGGGPGGGGADGRGGGP